MILYSNGCSHTVGHFSNFINTWPFVVMKGILNHNDFKVNPLKNQIKNEDVLFNEAESGAGNDYIFHTSIESISELIQKNKKPDYVFIQWSGPNRRVHQNIDEELIFINPHDNTKMGLKYEPMGSMHTLHYIFCMQEYLKKNNINYFFINYMALDKSIKKLSIYNQIDFDKFIYIDYDNDILFNGLIYHMKKNKLVGDKDGHPNNIGNFVIGNEILKKFNFKELYSKNFC